MSRDPEQDPKSEEHSDETKPALDTSENRVDANEPPASVSHVRFLVPMSTPLREQIKEQIRAWPGFVPGAIGHQTPSRSIRGWEMRDLVHCAEAYGVPLEGLRAILTREQVALTKEAAQVLLNHLRAAQVATTPTETSPLPVASPSAKMRIAKNIKKFRKECGWSLDELATNIESNKKNVIDHTKGRVKPNPKTLNVYAKVFSKALNRPITAKDLEE